MEKNKKRQLEETYQRFIYAGLSGSEPKNLEDYIDQKVVGFGTALDEKIRGIEEVQRLLETQKNQSEGLTITWKVTPVDHYTTEDENTAIFVDEIIVNIKSKDSELEFLLRISAVLEYHQNSWKVIHWHGSKPEEVESEKDTWGMDMYKQQAEKLQKLVDEKTADLQEKNRELEIEAALERVRARSSAMQYADELGEVIALIFNILDEFKISVKDGVALITFIEGSKDLNEWMANPGFGTAMNFYLPYFDHPVLSNLWEAKNRGDDIIIERYSAEESRSFLNHIFEHSDFKHTPQSVKEYCLAAETYATSIALQKHTAIFINDYSGISLTSSEVDLLKGFSAVFEQTYTRYLDIQKAEAQAREAQIVASLERVRTATMAMHQSNELGVVLSKLFEQFDVLGIKPSHAVLTLINEEKNTLNFRTTGKNGYQVLGEQEVDLTIVDAWLDTAEKWKKSEPNAVNVNEYPPEILPEVWEVYKDILDSMPKNARPEVEDFPEGLFITEGYCTFGYIGFAHNRKPTTEEKDIVKRIAAEFGTLYQRFLDLQKAEAQTREAQIQLALERVRARAMAMQTSEELADLSQELVKQVKALGVETWFCAFNIYEENGRESIEWGSNGMATFPRYKTPRENVFLEYYEAGQKGETLLINEIGEGECPAHYEYLCSLPGVGEQLLKMKAEGIPFPKYQIDHVAFFKFGYILFITYEAAPESHEVFKRFAREFEQAYTRFLDLKKAEAQTREAQVELSLERIRAQVTAMRESSELFDIVVAMRKEFITLGHEADYFWHMKWTEKSYEMSMTSEEGDRIGMMISIPKFVHDDIPRLAEWEKSDSNLYVLDLNGPEAWDYIEKMNTYGKYEQVDPHAPSEEDILAIGGLTFIIARTSHGEIGFSLAGQVPEPPQESLETLIRFAKVFGIAYKRFEDLKKAEEQAREAKVELSLERIRAQVTAMRESEELLEIVVNMRKEFVNLGHEAHYFWHMRWLPDTYAKAMTSGDGTQIGMVMSLPRHIHGDIPAVAAWEKSNEPTHILAMDIDLAVDYVDKMIKLGDFERVDPQAPTLDDIRHIGGLTFVMARTTHGEIGYSLPGKVEQPPQESIDTLTRFAGVFDLAYRRFEDLLTSEKQNRKAKIELALERVRARAMAMQEPEELVEVAQVLREEMGLLGVEELETSSIYINQGEQGKAQCWYSIKDIREGAKTYIADHFDLNYKDTWVGKQMFEFYQSDQTNTSILMQGEHRIEWINYCAKRTKKLDGYYGNEIPERTYHLTKFSNGAIGAATPGEISPESWELLRRAATVFSLAYSRFRDLSQARDDLKKLKSAKAKAEKALKELKAAQEQLVQQEKLASLGQLTAGIAHEIKNPLNFVNNFSDLSRELIEEVFEELENIDDSDAKEEIIAILNDVKGNLSKVYEHGSRADSIVKSMLQHSRASGSKREAKAFNPMVQEFVNLSFHGMRAGKAPINVEIDLQLDPKVGEVALISEDFSRVILNLCNNAFDAMRDKLKTEDGRQGAEAYLPKLSVKTALQKDKVTLSIQDNGGGIPDEIKDKILQPFFTTKKGTEGTGLGLSITNDIIKAHGGEIQIHSEQGSGATFIISLSNS